jgi:hypothetical protein
MCIAAILLAHVSPVLCDSSQAAPPTGVPGAARPVEDFNVPSVSAWQFENFLYLAVDGATDQKTSDADGLKIPRLANVVKRIERQGNADQQFQVHPEPTAWHIKPALSADMLPAVLILTLDSPSQVFRPDLIATASSEDIISLPAKLAITHGQTLRFEPQPHKNTVGYWSNEKDTAEWKLQIDKAGAYEVDILQGCGKGHGGSDVVVGIQDQTLGFKVQETGHFQNFIWRTLGTVTLKPSECESLQLIPKKKVAGAVMDVRAIRLVPVGVSRSFDAELADSKALPKRD